MLHNIERDVCLIKNNSHFLSKSYFLTKFNPLGNETCWKVWMLLFVDLLRPFMLFVSRVQIRVLSIWNIKVNYPSIEGFDVSMATFFVHPSRKWVDISMSFTGGGTSSPHQTNKAFTCGCALEYVENTLRSLKNVATYIICQNYATFNFHQTNIKRRFHKLY